MPVVHQSFVHFIDCFLSKSFPQLICATFGHKCLPHILACPLLLPPTAPLTPTVFFLVKCFHCWCGITSYLYVMRISRVQILEVKSEKTFQLKGIGFPQLRRREKHFSPIGPNATNCVQAFSPFKEKPPEKVTHLRQQNQTTAVKELWDSRKIITAYVP